MGEADGFKPPTISCTNARVTGSNESKTAEQGRNTEGSEAEGEISALVEETLSIKKNHRKFSHRGRGLSSHSL